MPRQNLPRRPPFVGGASVIAVAAQVMFLEEGCPCAQFLLELEFTSTVIHTSAISHTTSEDVYMSMSGNFLPALLDGWTCPAHASVFGKNTDMCCRRTYHGLAWPGIIIWVFLNVS